MTWEPIYDQVAARIKTLREAAGMTQAELAEEIGLSRTSLVNIEQGRQRVMLHQLQEIAEILGVPLLLLVDPEPWKQFTINQIRDAYFRE